MTFSNSFRKPVRVTITLPFHLRNNLQDRADEEGRSLSNLCSYLLERALDPRSIVS
jgi:hypothetical protein